MVICSSLLSAFDQVVFQISRAGATSLGFCWARAFYVSITMYGHRMTITYEMSSDSPCMVLDVTAWETVCWDRVFVITPYVCNMKERVLH